uniref:O-acyltransferase WSD1 C-terminal domain-containing protein n=1 Tax=Strombidium rassoulzadegani TaxID=1082188 RepID=A0A7S3FUI1_9SPIT|mmetsp:Transcript_1960/g.3422  ORF Transcript_1960/g.3422 Transcript_1960/m.3422 type:complete len:196 (+) Transcript_1960:1100-1687(+)
MAIPANVRFELYPSKEDVKLENRFSAFPIVLPLAASSMQESYPHTKKVNQELRSKQNFLYTSFFMSRLIQAVLPRSLVRFSLTEASKKMTLGFSNIPGPIKPFYYRSLEGEKIAALFLLPFMIVAGKVGLAINCISYNKSFRVCVTSDNGVLTKEQTVLLCDLIAKSIRLEIERVLGEDTTQPVEATTSESKKDQ